MKRSEHIVVGRENGVRRPLLSQKRLQLLPVVLFKLMSKQRVPIGRRHGSET
jgi:hypothetical protein